MAFRPVMTPELVYKARSTVAAAGHGARQNHLTPQELEVQILVQIVVQILCRSGVTLCDLILCCRDLILC
jgi:hypothetical protein